jgi:spermidine synthase
MGEGMGRGLLVNGIGMTKLTTITKCMTHLPLALHQGKAESVLVICFGMGTSYRAALSWDVQTTVVELVPGVKAAFGYYHADAEYWANHPKGHIVVDDGRRFLKRTAEKFDVIVIDPPPPIEAAGSSLLYSKEFYELARQHLKPGGILQMWAPSGDVSEHNSLAQQSAYRAVAGSIHDAFPHVRAYRSLEGWGVHYLASVEPLPGLTVPEFFARLPVTANSDLLEWIPREPLEKLLTPMLADPWNLKQLLPTDPHQRITDNHPFNEYFLLRSWGWLPCER